MDDQGRQSTSPLFCRPLKSASRETLVLPLALGDVHIAQGELLELLPWPWRFHRRVPPSPKLC